MPVVCAAEQLAAFWYTASSCMCCTVMIFMLCPYVERCCLCIQAVPGDPPQFLYHVQRQLALAGWQLRVLDKLKPASGCFPEQAKSIAAAEAREAALVTSSHLGDCWHQHASPICRVEFLKYVQVQSLYTRTGLMGLCGCAACNSAR